MKRMALLLAAVLAASTPLGALAQADAPSAGVVVFENSGAEAAQASFARGLALLHDFEYERAAAEFRSAQAADSGFAMAYWGEAMTHNHAIWMEQDLAAARAALAKLGKTAKARARKAGSERERDYLGAVETLYGEGSKEERDFRYEAAMAALHAKYPDDVDAAAFYALSILGTAHAGRDFAIYMRAAAILEEIYPENRDHPGVLHYLIHCYDDPVHAPLGLRAARLYGAVAPDAGHALHMTSHIFIALGMWDDVISMNQQAIAVVNAQRAAAGKDAAFCGHYASWLVYGHLQKRDVASARVYINGCRALVLKERGRSGVGSPDPDNSLLGSYLWVRTMLAADTGEWRSVDEVPLDDASGWELFSAAYGALLGANAAGVRTTLSASAQELGRLAPELIAELDRSGDANLARRAAVEAKRLQGEALVMLRGGDAEGGILLLQKAAAIEAAAPVEFGPPFVEKPSHELLGDELYRLKRFGEAKAAYQTALARMPGRMLALEGLARTKKAAP